MARRLYDLARLNHVIFPGIDRPRCADFLRDYYEYYAHGRGRAFRAKNAALYEAFRHYVPVRARSVARAWGKDERWIEQAIDWGRDHFCDPRDIATFEIEDERAFRDYQRRFEQVFVVRAIEGCGTEHADTLIDKACFQERAQALGLPVPRALATIDDGSIELHHGVERVLDVIVKPARGSGGVGIETATVRSETDLRGWPGARSGGRQFRGRWIVQERCRTHPGLADLALDALPTARIVTLLDENGQPEIVSQAMRFATRRDVPADNVHRGALAAAIDPVTGTLLRSLAMNGPGRYPRHPLTGVAIEGRCVPDWSAAKDLALRAHGEAFPDHVLIGWDIGFTDRGPILIEGNQRPNVRLTQRVAGRGIGSMRYGALIEHHLRRRIEQGEPLQMRFLAYG